MSPTSTDLLRLLDPGLGAARALAQALPRSDIVAGLGTAFADLLAKAQRGEVSSGLPVNVDAGVGVTLDAGQLQRLAKAADSAEAAGMHTAAVLIDGLSLVLNVHTRTITRQIDLASSLVTGIDGIVPVPGDGALASTGLVRLPGAGLPLNASVASLLNALAHPQSPTGAGS